MSLENLRDAPWPGGHRADKRVGGPLSRVVHGSSTLVPESSQFVA